MVASKSLGKDVVRGDFEPQQYDREIRAYGYRLYWQSAEMCPCRNNDVTDQPDPTCIPCDGEGWIYTFPDPNELTIEDYLADDPPFLDTATARATQAIVTAMTHDTQTYEKFGEWLAGAARLTTFSFNRIAFRDRFTHAESVMPYKQVLTVPASKIFLVGNTALNKLRYPAVKLLRIVELPKGASIFIDRTEDATITDTGGIDLTASSVAPGTRLGIRYDMHPVWIVNDFPFATRDSLVKAKTPNRMGQQLVMPVHAFVKLDFLLASSTAPP